MLENDLDIWAIENDPDCIHAALDQIKISTETLEAIAKTYNISVLELKSVNNLETDVLEIGQELIISNDPKIVHVVKPGDVVIYSNVLCELDLGGVRLKTRQFDTFIHSNENGVLIMLMRDGKVSAEDAMKLMDDRKINFSSVSFVPSIRAYKETYEIPELWIVRDIEVASEALEDSIQKGNTTCDFYPTLEGKLDLSYVLNNSGNEKNELDTGHICIDGRTFLGLINLEDKLIIFVDRHSHKTISASKARLLMESHGISYTEKESINDLKPILSEHLIKK